jgi:gamma-D-glutamyl-L-lysine dipeptidyl-peptidase
MSASVEPGTSHVIVDAAVPLWTSPEAAIAHVGPSKSAYRSYPEGLEQLVGKHGSLSGRVDTVAISGEHVRVVDETQEDGCTIVRVELLAQPNGSSGYVGFMDPASLGPDARRCASHVVREFGATASVLGGNGAPIELPAGTTVEFLDLDGDEVGLVLLASGERVRCAVKAVTPCSVAMDPVGIFDVARGFIGVPYVWGGTERSGIDCSGLVHMAARIGGRLIPRDAHYQWAATRSEHEWADLMVGDLVFFGDSPTIKDIEHVGLYAGDGQLLHAPEEGRSVTLEPITASGRERMVGFGRIQS